MHIRERDFFLPHSFLFARKMTQIDSFLISDHFSIHLFHFISPREAVVAIVGLLLRANPPSDPVLLLAPVHRGLHAVAQQRAQGHCLLLRVRTQAAEAAQGQLRRAVL